MKLFGRGKEKKDGGQAFMAVFEYLDDCVAAIKAMHERGISIVNVYSPFRSDEINEAMDMKPSPVRYFTLVGGILGISTGLGLAFYTASVWKFVIWGKPWDPITPFVIVAFEFCILTGVLFTLLGVAATTRLPNYRIPAHYDVRFSKDRYGLLVHAAAAEIDQVRTVLEKSGAEEVHAVE